MKKSNLIFIVCVIVFINLNTIYTVTYNCSIEKNLKVVEV